MQEYVIKYIHMFITHVGNMNISAQLMSLFLYHSTFTLKLIELRLDKETFYGTCVHQLLSSISCEFLSKSSNMVSEIVFHQALSQSLYYHHRPRSRKRKETGPIMCYCIIYKFHAHVKDRIRPKFIIFVSTFQNYSHLYDSVIVSSIKLLE